MLRKEKILERTSNGLSVFKHYVPGNWRIGRNFLNPLYEDNKASCNIYFDRRSGIYKMKDFGNDNYSGDCFFFVGQLKGLDCNNSMDFIEILETIDRDLGLGLATGNPIPVTRTSCRIVDDIPEETPEKESKPYQFREQKFPLAELMYWQQYGITPEVLELYKVCSLRDFQSVTADGTPFTYTSSVTEPMYGYKSKRYIKLYNFKLSPLLWLIYSRENFVKTTFTKTISESVLFISSSSWVIMRPNKFCEQQIMF